MKMVVVGITVNTVAVCLYVYMVCACLLPMNTSSEGMNALFTYVSAVWGRVRMEGIGRMEVRCTNLL